MRSKMWKKWAKNKKGTTLVELSVTLALFTLLTTSVMSVVFSGLHTITRLRTEEEAGMVCEMLLDEMVDRLNRERVAAWEAEALEEMLLPNHGYLEYQVAPDGFLVTRSETDPAVFKLELTMEHERTRISYHSFRYVRSGK